jgi:hypothetical protein
MDSLGDQGGILSSAPVASSDAVELGPTAAGPDTLPPLPNVSVEAFFLDETGQWKPFNPRIYGARTIFSEGTMAFSAFRQEGASCCCRARAAARAAGTACGNSDRRRDAQ